MGGVDDAVMVWPDMASAVTLFLALGTQWRIGMAGATGLDYGAVRETAAMLEIAMTPGVMLDLRVMERQALKAWRK